MVMYLEVYRDPWEISILAQARDLSCLATHLANVVFDEFE